MGPDPFGTRAFGGDPGARAVRSRGRPITHRVGPEFSAQGPGQSDVEASMPPFQTPTRTGATVCPDCREAFVVPRDCLPLDDGYVVELVCTNCCREELV